MSKLARGVNSLSYLGLQNALSSKKLRDMEIYYNSTK